MTELGKWVQDVNRQKTQATINDLSLELRAKYKQTNWEYQLGPANNGSDQELVGIYFMDRSLRSEE